MQRLDSQIVIETPEGISLPLTPAGPGVRILAFLIDAIIRYAIVFAVFLVLQFFGDIGSGIGLIAMFLFEWFYPVFFDIFRHGVTPGKKSFNLRVIHDDGTPICFSSSVVRNLLRVADFLPSFYILGVLCMMSNRRFQRLGDLAAGTLVVYDSPSPQFAESRIEGSQPFPAPLNWQQQQAIIQFSERCNTLSEARQQELANLLTPITQDRDQAAVNTLLRVANGILGRQ
ncbi:RDD family protein [Endozoicomonas sp. SM1973]|uniref:RDD family protein n=1 Tax=Spartinivicinus marinus TaxID=2994442 RepID=A0A853I5X0_9GAMM|nr:RDD family protein [Spartinivicinus marinus]MCX4028883.1 RDD family protein [Spartinivicinus marinus]NYZ65534.1 RDD family protein [Spartinivicinus marinus]